MCTVKVDEPHIMHDVTDRESLYHCYDSVGWYATRDRNDWFGTSTPA